MFIGMGVYDYARMMGMLGEEDECFVDDRPTWPVPGTASLSVEEKAVALFTSAEWVIVAEVNGKEVARSEACAKPYTKDYLRQWARDYIVSTYSTLRGYGVDAEAEYVKHGGNASDLDFTK